MYDAFENILLTPNPICVIASYMVYIIIGYVRLVAVVSGQILRVR